MYSGSDVAQPQRSTMPLTPTPRGRVPAASDGSIAWRRSSWARPVTPLSAGGSADLDLADLGQAERGTVAGVRIAQAGQQTVTAGRGVVRDAQQKRVRNQLAHQP